VDEPSLVIEPFSPLDRAAFSCGQPALDAYLQRQASQDVRRRVAQVFVASASGLRRSPHYPVPAAVLGRLAITRDQQGRGLGEGSSSRTVGQNTLVKNVHSN
jgi:hypothetical protein